MSRLRLFGEPQGNGTEDHSALSNLDYARSGHSGFVPSQGVALVDILRLNQDVIQDSGSNDRITLSTASPHIRTTGNARLDGLIAQGADPDPYIGVNLRPSISNAIGGTVLNVLPSGFQQTGGANKLWRGLLGVAGPSIASGASAYARGLDFATIVGGAGDLLEAIAVHVEHRMMGYSGAAAPLYGFYYKNPTVFAATAPSDDIGFYMADHGTSLGAVATNVLGIRIEDQSNVTGNVRLLELGPSTPHLRLVGGGDPPTNKSNLYLKFGNTLYRVVKSGSYMTLEVA
jgi:hypothetical protein